MHILRKTALMRQTEEGCGKGISAISKGISAISNSKQKKVSGLGVHRCTVFAPTPVTLE